MLKATRDKLRPTTITGSYPRLSHPGAGRIAFYTSVALNLGANLVGRELKLAEVAVPAANPRFTFAG